MSTSTVGSSWSTSTVDLERVAADVERDGFSIVPDVLSPEELERAAAQLWVAKAESERRGVPTRMEQLDPNASSVRVMNLLDLDPIFVDLLEHPVADAIVSRVLGPNYIVSNFTAHITRPGSGSMAVHSDQALAAPEPWLEPWAMNIIWCLSDVRAENGATHYLPGSHRWTTLDDVPPDLRPELVAFEAPAGSILVMEGRLWHTSGCNTTADEDRTLAFAYYIRPFLRPQWNFTAAMRPDMQALCSTQLRYRLGLDLQYNSGTNGLRLLAARD